MRIVAFSDLHAHPFKAYATVLADGVNSRLADAIECIRQVREYARRFDADLVLFGGDMFHVRRTISVQAFNAVYEEMAKFRIEGVPVAMIHGNHDQADREGTEHSIHAFRTFSTVIDTPSWVDLEGKSGKAYQLLAVPYLENVEVLKDIAHNTPAPIDGTPRIFLGHFGVQGAKVGADFVYVNPHDAVLDDMNPGTFDVGLLGHYHLHQALGSNFHYIGAPLQHNWGDAGQARGFVMYDTDSKQVEFVPLQAPQFVVQNAASGLTAAPDSFLKVLDYRAWSDDEREQKRIQLQARTLEVYPIEPPSSKSQTAGPRLDVAPGTSFQDMIERYVTSGVQPADGLDLDYLIQIGQEVFQEVESD